MSTRSTERTITFSHSVDGQQPSGAYQLITEETQLEGLSVQAFQRVRTLLFLPSNSRPGHARKVVDVDSAELAAALAADVVASVR
jgi:hypothetical protein